MQRCINYHANIYADMYKLSRMQICINYHVNIYADMYKLPCKHICRYLLYYIKSRTTTTNAKPCTRCCCYGNETSNKTGLICLRKETIMRSLYGIVNIAVIFNMIITDSAWKQLCEIYHLVGRFCKIWKYFKSPIFMGLHCDLKFSPKFF